MQDALIDYQAVKSLSENIKRQIGVAIEKGKNNYDCGFSGIPMWLLMTLLMEQPARESTEFCKIRKEVRDILIALLVLKSFSDGSAQAKSLIFKAEFGLSLFHFARLTLRFSLFRGLNGQGIEFDSEFSIKRPTNIENSPHGLTNPSPILDKNLLNDMRSILTAKIPPAQISIEDKKSICKIDIPEKPFASSLPKSTSHSTTTGSVSILKNNNSCNNDIQVEAAELCKSNVDTTISLASKTSDSVASKQISNSTWLMKELTDKMKHRRSKISIIDQ